MAPAYRLRDGPAVRVDQLGESQLVLPGVVLFDIADQAFGLSDIVGDAFIALGAARHLSPACTDVTAAIAPPAMRERWSFTGALLLVQVFAVAITFKPESGSNLHEKRSPPSTGCPDFGCHDAALVSPRHGDGTLPVLPQSRPWNASLRWASTTGRTKHSTRATRVRADSFHDLLP